MASSPDTECVIDDDDDGDDDGYDDDDDDGGDTVPKSKTDMLLKTNKKLIRR